MDTDMMIMAQPDFMTALVVHIAGALVLFLAFGLEIAFVLLLHRATTVGHVRLALHLTRRLPAVFGGATAGIVASGLYMGYLDWHGGEEIGWIIAALVLFVLSSIVGSTTSRRLTAALSAALASTQGTMSDELRRELRRVWPGAWLRISICTVLGILVVMVVQPGTLIAVVILLAAVTVGLIAASRSLTTPSQQS